MSLYDRLAQQIKSEQEAGEMGSRAAQANQEHAKQRKTERTQALRKQLESLNIKSWAEGVAKAMGVRLTTSGESLIREGLKETYYFWKSGDAHFDITALLVEATGKLELLIEYGKYQQETPYPAKPKWSTRISGSDIQNEKVIGPVLLNAYHEPIYPVVRTSNSFGFMDGVDGHADSCGEDHGGNF